MTKCETCADNKYVFTNRCYTTCPERTVKDEVAMKCKACQTGCLECKHEDESICLRCEQDLLLFKGRCMSQCPELFRPNFENTKCVAVTSITHIPFPILILVVLAGATAYGGQYSSKNQHTRAHRKMLSFFAFLGVLDVLAIWA